MFINLTTSQRAGIELLLATYEERPTTAQYFKGVKVLERIPAPKPRQSTKIPGTKPGIHGIERWSSPLFIPDGCKNQDIPEGLALVPIWDSGNNHALHNAATSLWCRMWNNWGHRRVWWSRANGQAA